MEGQLKFERMALANRWGYSIEKLKDALSVDSFQEALGYFGQLPANYLILPGDASNWDYIELVDFGTK